MQLKSVSTKLKEVLAKFHLVKSKSREEGLFYLADIRKSIEPFFQRFVDEYDEYKPMSKELGDELFELFSNKDNIIGVHLSGYNPIVNENHEKYMKNISEYFEKGLVNNQDAGYGIDTTDCKSVDTEKTVTYTHDFAYLVGLLKTAENYKGSEGAFILSIPKSYIGEGEGEVKPIYYADGYIKHLLPEYIYGFIPAKDKLDTIINNPNYKNEHDYDNEGLFYDQAAYYKQKKETSKS